MPELQNSTERALIACSLWLHLGFIGAAAVAAGLLLFFGTEATWLSALALAFSGGALVAASWRRARTVLEHAGRVSAGATPAASKSASRLFQANRTRRDGHVVPYSAAREREAR